MKQVDGARVHLAVPQQSAFVRDRRPASASVFLNLKSGRRLDREQVTSIVNLVASSIPELDARMVTVIDAQGRLLSAPRRTARRRSVSNSSKSRAAWKRTTPRASNRCSRR